MTCKDCIHFDVCHIIETYGAEDINICKNFKNKANFVELPCKVGDVVYADCEYFGILKYLVSNFHITYMGKEENYLHWEAVAYAPDTDELLDEMEFDIDEIGKYVFFTYEEAEQKLKEGVQE